ncbi:hypothetical protein [Parvularcula maris]|uniref:Uncharacterized protein n=1 Tax=Parvularcula maris TaxID=2965077 RepID=A0A9X2RHA6_9PROT|nr:hypothetical protein [Parvularcula maris]MCQ8184740.1 hypothetical protein [Parvularcula maris]
MSVESQWRSINWLEKLVEAALLAIGVVLVLVGDAYNEQNLRKKTAHRLVSDLAPIFENEADGLDAAADYLGAVIEYAQVARMAEDRDSERFITSAVLASESTGIDLTWEVLSDLIGADALTALDSDTRKQALKILSADGDHLRFDATAPYRKALRSALSPKDVQAVRRTCKDERASGWLYLDRGCVADLKQEEQLRLSKRIAAIEGVDELLSNHIDQLTFTRSEFLRHADMRWCMAALLRREDEKLPSACSANAE